jgi:hypothetical protein
MFLVATKETLPHKKWRKGKWFFSEEKKYSARKKVSLCFPFFGKISWHTENGPSMGFGGWRWFAISGQNLRK